MCYYYNHQYSILAFLNLPKLIVKIITNVLSELSKMYKLLAWLVLAQYSEYAMCTHVMRIIYLLIIYCIIQLVDINTNSGRLTTWTTRTNDLKLSRQCNVMLYILIIINLELDFSFMVILFIRFKRRILYFISFIKNTILTH